MENEISKSVPASVVARVSDDLLETPVLEEKSSVFVPQTFSAADFNDSATTTQQAAATQTTQQTQVATNQQQAVQTQPAYPTQAQASTYVASQTAQTVQTAVPQAYTTPGVNTTQAAQKVTVPYANQQQAHATQYAATGGAYASPTSPTVPVQQQQYAVQTQTAASVIS